MNQCFGEAFQNFGLEQYQSLYEHTVELNLADSSVQCPSIREWLTDDDQHKLLETALYYPQVNGTVELRQRIAALYPGATDAHVLVAVGAAEANKIMCEALLRPGDEVVVLSPGYRQVWGLAVNLGCVVKELVLRPEDDWRPDLDALDRLVGPRTKLVAVVNPHNPTGVVFTDGEMQRIVAACARVGAWLHADEVYTGTEHNNLETPSFWGRYDRVVCTNSLSKAYGLAGLRIGWIATNPDTIEALWRRHEYAVIAAAAPSMTLATMALGAEKRSWLLQRQRAATNAGRHVLQEWLASHGDRFSIRPSAATGVAFVRYESSLSSYEMAEHIRRTVSVLVAPGVLLGAEQHLRLAIGYAPARIRTALDRIATVRHP